MSLILVAGVDHLTRLAAQGQAPTATGEFLATGVRITPTAADGAIFQPLNPDLPTRPDILAGQAVTTAVSPDAHTLLILTSGYNRNVDSAGEDIPEESAEYVFVYDIAGNVPVKRQILRIPNTFIGIAWHPSAQEFYVSGGVDDNLHVFKLQDGLWSEDGNPISLGHTAGHGLQVPPMAAGLAVTASGKQLLVANFENDSMSVIDLTKRSVIAEVDLRPGKIDAAQQGVPGGEYPFWIVIRGDSKAYVSSQRDHEVVVLDLTTSIRMVSGRIQVGSQPNKIILSQTQTRLYVANGNSGSVSAIDTATDSLVEEIDTTAPHVLSLNLGDLKGSNPNSLALSADERTLYVTNGGTNSVAVIRLGTDQAQSGKSEDDEEGEAAARHRSRVIGLIPTGWYPNSVSLNKAGSWLYVVNGKSNAGPNPGACRDTSSIQSGALNDCLGRNLYVWHLTKAGFLSLPLPAAANLAKLSWQVAENNNFPIVHRHREGETLMAFLRDQIKHVIYIVKENRTYDQILGDLEVGNGDPSLTVFPEPITPNHHDLARKFVTFDNFLDSGEVSGSGWNWSTAARTTDFTEKTVPVVRFPHDHLGNFATAIDGVNTPDTQMADNDYAIGLLVEKVSKSPYKDDTLLFIVEDDAQNGGDHVDAHRSIAYIIGPYVKQGAVVATLYTTVSLLRTIEEILGLEPMGLTDGLAEHMADTFEETLRSWTYSALVPEVLRTTQLPLPAKTAQNGLPLTEHSLVFAKPRRDAAYWQRVMAGQDFTVEDNLYEQRFNRALWRGLMGEETPYPETRHGRDLSHDRDRLLQAHRENVLRSSASQAEKISSP
jgi:YVTN family beta-propeller protein